jgi:hypothetical protein
MFTTVEIDHDQVCNPVSDRRSGAVCNRQRAGGPLMPTAPALSDGVESVRLICNEWGRCWRTGGPRYYGDRYGYNSYNYYGGPRYRRHYGYGPGVQFNAPGVHFGFGVGPSW